MNLRMGVMLACIGLAACGTRPGETGGLFHESVGVVALYHEDGRPVSHDERPTYHGGPGLAPKTILPDTLNVLALSGGGSHGAFGAGLLNGLDAIGQAAAIRCGHGHFHWRADGTFRIYRAG